MKADALFWAKVDKSGECWLWTGRTTAKGYGQLNRKGRVSYAHRYVLELSGIDVAGWHVDHICHQTSCVRPDHLRRVTNKQNHENLLGAYANSKSGVRGVYWDNYSKSWRASIGHAGKQYGKRFSSLDAAADWVRAKRIELFTHNDADRVAS